MARLVLITNPLAPLRDREEVDLAPGRAVIDWLQEFHPTGCGGPLRFFVNGGELDLDDLDLVPEPDDVVTLVACPAEPISLTMIITAVVVAVISTALSVGISLIFKKSSSPAFATSQQESGQRQPSTVYDVRAQQNAPRIGECIPAIYGQVLTTPDYAAMPHIWFDNENEQWMDSLMVIGQGEYQIDQVLLGDTDVRLLDPGVFTWASIPASQHLQQMGRLGFFSDFYENLITCPEVDGQSFERENEEAGFFQTSKTGQRGRVVEIDVVFPAGLYRQNTWGGGGITNTHMHFALIAQNLETNAVQVHEWYETRYYENDPLRATYRFDLGVSALWGIKLQRKTGKDQAWTNLFKWTQLKLYADYRPAPIYGDVTLFAVRLKASQGIGDGQQKIRVRCTRRLPHGGEGPLAPTRNPADAFIDIYCNQIYGARRPLAEVDRAKVGQLRNLWAGYYFDAVFTGAVTVWQALSHSIQGMAATPLPLGSYLSIAQDGIKPTRTMLFSEQNIVRDTFALSYEFDKVGTNDGIEIEYRETANFSPAYVRVPGWSVDPEKVVLFGCTDINHAREYAQLLWNRKQIQRKTIEFETELEGLIPYPGERVAVSHTLPRWGESGYVAGADYGLRIVTVDRPLPWAETAPPYVMAFRDSQGRMSSLVTAGPGALPNQAWLPTWPTDSEGLPLVMHIGEREENTHFVFGSASTVVRDFVVNDIKPKGGVRVGLIGLVYNTTVYQGAMRFLGGPVP